MLQIGGNFGWGPGTLDLKFFCNLILGSRVINISKRYIKVYYRPAGSDRPAKAKLYTQELCLVSIWIGPMGFWLMGHRRTMLFLLPDANRVPSSENSTALAYPVWPSRSLQLNNEVTFDSLRWWTANKHFAAKVSREPRRFCPWSDDWFLSSSSTAAAASVAVLLTDLLATLWVSAIGCSTVVWKKIMM